jgi:hypothetical protein
MSWVVASKMLFHNRSISSKFHFQPLSTQPPNFQPHLILTVGERTRASWRATCWVAD